MENLDGAWSSSGNCGHLRSEPADRRLSLVSAFTETTKDENMLNHRADLIKMLILSTNYCLVLGCYGAGRVLVPFPLWEHQPNPEPKDRHPWDPTPAGTHLGSGCRGVLSAHSVNLCPTSSLPSFTHLIAPLPAPPPHLCKRPAGPPGFPSIAQPCSVPWWPGAGCDVPVGT